MRKMKIYREIRIQKLQTKNRMVGQTFNPSGHTSESLDKREKEEVERINKLSRSEFEELKAAYEAIRKCKLDNNIYCTNSFNQNVFIRNFGHLTN